MKVKFAYGKSFKIIPENKIVVGQGEQKGFMEELSDVCTNKELLYMPVKFVDDDLHVEDYNYAKAKCDPKDTWNEKTGVDIVSAKLDMKEHLRKARRYEKALVTMNSLMRKMEDLLDKHLKKAKAIRKDLEEYYGGIYR